MWPDRLVPSETKAFFFYTIASRVYTVEPNNLVLEKIPELVMVVIHDYHFEFFCLSEEILNIYVRISCILVCIMSKTRHFFSTESDFS